MFKRKSKPTLQDLEREFSIQSVELGNITFQLQRLDKAKARTIQLMENLIKDSEGLREKIKKEIDLIVANGQKAEKPNEVH